MTPLSLAGGEGGRVWRGGGRDCAYTHRVRALFVAAVVVLFGCPLPTNVLYRCEENGSCAEGLTCAGDGYCHPDADVLEDGGVRPDDAGVCLTADELAAQCAATECGFLDDGCGGKFDCRHECPSPLECGVNEPHRCAVPSLCTDEGWCWESPLPQGYHLYASLRLDARHTWFVGENHVVVFFDGEKSSLQEVPAPPGVDLLGIHGTAPDDVFVVGNNGIIFHFNGTLWERESTVSGFTSQLRTVWSMGDGGAVAAGPGGRLLSRAAAMSPFSRWTLETFPSIGDIRDVFADSAGGVYAVTRGGELFTRPAGTTSNWTRLDTVPLGETMAGLPRAGGLTFGGTSLTRATLVHRDADGGWRALTDAGFPTFELVPGEGGLFALSQGGDFAWLDDAEGFTRFAVQPAQWNTGAALPGPRLLLAGLAGSTAIADLDGGLTWRSTPRITRGLSLNAVCGYAPGAMFAVGGTDSSVACNNCQARWLEREVTSLGAQWFSREFQLGGTTALLGCYAEGPDRVWFPGNDTKFIYREQGQPRYGDFGGTLAGQYEGAWGSAAAGYFFTRSSAWEVTTSADGVNNFSATAVGATAGLRSVWGLGADDVLVVGNSGAASHFDGVSWTAGDLGWTDFAAVHGARAPSGERHYVAVGSGGSLFTVLGDAGVMAQVSPQVSFSAAWVSARGSAWAVGRASDGGAYVTKSELNGPWVQEALSSPRPVTGLYGFDLEDGGASVWLSGPLGMILRKDEP